MATNQKQKPQVPQPQPDDSDAQPRSISFVADTTYASTYLKNVYESDEYHNQISLIDEFQKNFLLTLNSNPAYVHLRSIDKGMLKLGDEVLFNINNKRYFIISILDDIAVLRNNEEDVEANYENITPVDDILSKLKPEILSDLYMNIRRNIDITYYTEISFFTTFIEYFKCSEKILYNHLNITAKQQLIKELNDKTGFLKKRSLQSLW